MLRSRWYPGPAGAQDADSGGTAGRSGPLIVSATAFTPGTRRDLPGIARRGMALRRHWPRLEGAVGMWVWVMPVAGRCGSVSVWTGRRALAGFIRLPEHVAIMGEYRDRGTTRSVIREYESLDVTRVRRDMEAWLRTDVGR